MHIPDSMLQGQICPLSALISVMGVGAAAWKAFFSKLRPTASRFAAVTALIFAGQMMNFPINSGTSGHLLGGVLAAALLGIPFGILSMALVVTIQCLVFSDGGFSVLGANILNMAIIGAGLGGIIQAAFKRRFPLKSLQYGLGLGFAAWVSVIMAVFACSLELAFSGTIPFLKVIGAMLSVHAFIGLGEAAITVAVCFALASVSQKSLNRKSPAVPLLAAGVIAFILSPFASGLPDGLEWIAQKYQFFHQAAPTFVSPLPDYAVPAVNNEILATSLAGLAGVAITFLTAWIIVKLLNKFAKLAISR